MRTLTVAFLIAAASGLVGASWASAAPARAVALEPAGNTAPLASPARYYRSHGRVCFVKCYRDFLIGPRVCRRFC